MAFDEGEGDRILRAGSPMIIDLDAAYAELWTLARRIGWYAMYTACVKYVGKHGVVVPDEKEGWTFQTAKETLERSLKALEERKPKQYLGAC